MQSTIVVIEDDRDIRGLIQAILTGVGFRAEVAETGATGVEAVRQHNPCLTIVDFGLPDITGIEAIQRIRGFSQMPILMLTGHEDLAERPYAAGADDVMTKPFSPKELRKRVKELRENHEQAIPAGEATGQFRSPSQPVIPARTTISSRLHLSRERTSRTPRSGAAYPAGSKTR